MALFIAAAWVQSLVRELRSYKSHGAAKNRNKNICLLKNILISKELCIAKIYIYIMYYM